MQTNQLTKYLNEMHAIIVQKFSPERIYIFGSFARGEATNDSDLDLLLEFKEIPNKRNLTIQIRKALADIPCAKDILVATPEEMENYKDKNWSIYSQAQKEGKVIYDRKIK
ncbi:MAG: nucleotidyltransferase domain-containing protein [Leptospiraceae bacterium]|nr:nucleotidyltransferase domain-containing protein [Leptospiraceae bacterium]